ncbi:MAG: hypothetical protein RL637_487 [Pseudomonadota bacterium]
MLPSVRADRVAVIMAKDNRDINLSFKELQNIFRRKVLVNANGQAWIPLNLTANHVLRIAFAQKLFDQPPEAMENYWNELYFQGIMPPYVVDSEEAMLRFVSNTPGAIGYVLPCHLDNRVQVVANLKVNEPVEQGCNAVIP